jgi:hypothetical protein
MPPVVTSSVASKMHVYQALHSSQLNTTRRICTYAAARAREEYQALTSDARRLLKYNGAVKDIRERQRNPSVLSFPAAPKKLTSHFGEVELLQGLKMIKRRLDIDISHARSVGNMIAHRNYRRKRQQVKKLWSQLSARTAQSDEPYDDSNMSPSQERQQADFKHEPFVLSPEQWASQKELACELVKETIMNEF